MPIPDPRPPSVPQTTAEILAYAAMGVFAVLMPKRDRARALALMEKLLGDDEHAHNVLRLHSRPRDRLRATNMREARAWLAKATKEARKLPK